MRQTNFALAVLKGLAVLAVLSLAIPASAAPRSQSGGGRQTSSRPAPSGGGGSARPAPSGGSGGGSNGGGQSAPAPRAVPKSSGGTTSGTGNTSGGSGGTTSTGSGAGATASRPTSNRTAASGATVGHAARPINGGTTVVIPNGYYGGFYPWGWAGLGFGGYYGGYYGYYDPWIDGGGYYGQPYYTTSGYDDGLLRLKVKPRDGMVYVDGSFAGVVDDFDGIFQRLHIEPGAHHIEIMADGYEPLEINVQIQRGRTVTYSGDLKKIQ